MGNPNETIDYKITIDYKKNPQKVIVGTFDKNGLPDDFEEFADTVFDFMRFYGLGGILDPSVYGKIKRRTTDSSAALTSCQNCEAILQA
ncbi:MAG: hypothetical protein LUI05_09070, partial [Oscillospiraceae bacterium]|nr:hypothetical protein [Oscillospiraceae bacterium]